MLHWVLQLAGVVALIVIAVPIVILVLSGETASVAHVAIRQQGKTPLLFGPAYNYPVRSYKLFSVRSRRPKIIALGSSRVMQFRAEFFARPQIFYNAGGAVTSIRDIQAFVERLRDDELPQVVLLGLDQWLFNPQWNSKAQTDEEFEDQKSGLNTIQRCWRIVWRDLRTDRIGVRALLARHAVGINAAVRGVGFRNDGSYDYGYAARSSDMSMHWDPNFENTLERVAKGIRRFEWADRVDPKAIAETERLLGYLAQREIKVLGFLPPYAPAVIDRMMASRHYGYLDELAPTLRPLFAKHGFDLFDFTNPSAVGAPDGEFVDGFHGSDAAYARILRHLGFDDPSPPGAST